MEDEQDLSLDRARATEARAEIAFKDYLLQSHPRSIDRLLSEYQEKNQAFGRGTAPTTNRETIYRWSKEYEWKKRADEHDTKVARSETRSYDVLRTMQFDNLFNLSESAFEALKQLIENPETRADVRLKAAQTVYDRIGVTSAVMEAANTAPQGPSDVPSPDADQATIHEWLTRQHK